VAAPALALAAAAEAPTSFGLKPLILGDPLEGEARGVGKVMGGMALSSRSWGLPVGGPAVLLSGGETTVSIGPGPAGKGGPDTELLLSLALALKARDGIWAIASNSDGIDGVEDAAGAPVAPNTFARMNKCGFDPKEMLARHDSYRSRGHRPNSHQHQRHPRHPHQRELANET
jgi:hydroxypyruvate reductase